ncbi:MAG: hypothetical protein RL223_350 [Pseudomonadota bacterium]
MHAPVARPLPSRPLARPPARVQQGSPAGLRSVCAWPLAVVGALLAGQALMPRSAHAAGTGLQPKATTVDLLASGGRLSAGLGSTGAVSLRGVSRLDNGDLLRGELLRERKFGETGGIAGLGYTRQIHPDHALTATVSRGQGGLSWARMRGDLELASTWGPARNLVTRMAVYRARYDSQRSDTGLRLGLAVYMPGGLALEGGVTYNRSQPGSVGTAMPFVAATLGQEGDRIVSLRVAHGREGWQPIGEGLSVQDFTSTTVGLNWRQWLASDWGVLAQAEYYRNPTYHRTTLGAGLFGQW